jgi:hypothetical protein
MYMCQCVQGGGLGAWWVCSCTRQCKLSAMQGHRVATSTSTGTLEFIWRVAQIEKMWSSSVCKQKQMWTAKAACLGKACIPLNKVGGKAEWTEQFIFDLSLTPCQWWIYYTTHSGSLLWALSIFLLFYQARPAFKYAYIRLPYYCNPQECPT